jgi:hypothetical protein
MDSQLRSDASSNRVIQLVREAAVRNWCLRPFCTTCCNMNFRRALEGISDLTLELVSLDISELHDLPNGEVCLTIITSTQRVDWDRILAAWNPRIGEDARLADLVLFRIIGRNLPFQRSQAMRDWIAVCAELAVKTKDASLIESLVYVLGVHGEGLSAYPTLLTVAREVGEVSNRVRQAMAKAGPMLSTEHLLHEQKVAEEAIKASQNIFSAIQSNDRAGVTALLKKMPDLSVRNKDGLTALELARKLGRPEIECLLCRTPVPDSKSNSTAGPGA